MPHEGSPRISVICTFLNAEQFIEEALESVFAQDFKDWELLLVDDGSTDRSTEIARSFAARFPMRVTYLEHARRQNLGTSASRNVGMDHAKGEFIAFIDADDVWRQNKLSVQIALMEHFPDCAMVCGRVNYWESWNGGVDSLSQTGGLSDVILTPPDALLRLYPLGPAPGAGPSEVLVRTKDVRDVGGFEDRFMGLFEDQACFVKIYCNAAIYISGATLVDYRQHSGSITVQSERDNLTIPANRQFYRWLRGYLLSSEAPGSREALRRVRHELRWLAVPILWRLRRKWRVFRQSGGIRSAG